MFTLRVTIDFIDEIGFVGTTEHRAILGPPGQDKRISQRAAFADWRSLGKRVN